jgi:serine/threonine protein kinase
MDLEPGSQFGRYTIVGLVGTGGMGHVYQARDRELERLIALKLIRTDRASESAEAARARERLFREARAAAALEHVNVVSIFDIGVIDGSPFIAMEFVKGRSLRALVGDPAIGFEERVRWLLDIARALGAAHARGLVHRDVKPDNVMLRDDGVIKVLDFGIARPALTGQPPSEVAPQEGRMAGTPRYMAPEQLRGEPVDGRTDQFSWGVLAYEVLTGRRPWSGEVETTTYELVASILHDEPEPPSVSSPLLRGGVERVVLRTLSKVPADRYASMEEVAAELGAAAASAPPMRTADAESISPRAPRRSRATALAVVAALLVGVVGVVTLRARSLPPNIPLANPSPSIPNAPAPITLADLPVPESTLPDARAAYVVAMQAFRDGSPVQAMNGFVTAATLDPMMAAAHLRAHIVLPGGAETEGQGHLQRAMDLRARLTPRDQAILDAFAPAYLSHPVDAKEATRRLLELAHASPNDLEVQYFAAAREVDMAKRDAALERVAALDPKFAAPLWLMATDLLPLADKGALDAMVDRCLSVALSTSCLSVRALAHEDRGECEAMEADARRMLARGDTGWRAYGKLARALVAIGQPAEAVRAALAQKWSTAPASSLRTTQITDEASLAILSGDFVSARARAAELEQLVATEPLEAKHEDASWLLVDLYAEMGMPDRAARAADEFLKTRSGWQSMGRWSPRPLFYAVAVHGGLRTEEERRTARDRWLSEWASGDPLFLPQQWIHGYAFPATTAAEGREALAAAPTPIPRPMFNEFHRNGFESVGRVYLLAGRPAEALPHLRQAAASCSALAAPFSSIHAHLYLAEALEATNDLPGACAEYATVLAHWGSARPRSVSAATARARVKALACARE